MHETPADHRIADALDEMNQHVTEVRECVETTRRKITNYMPWVLVWLLIAIMNLDEGTRRTVQSIATAAKETAKLAQ